jgi:DNA-directed RNA polymerase specialized sigma24 family protein
MYLPVRRALSRMQAEGQVVRLPVVQEGPLDFATFFADEHRELFRLLRFVTGSRADAAHLMQDAFLKLWERWDRPVPRGRASASSRQPLPSR